MRKDRVFPKRTAAILLAVCMAFIPFHKETALGEDFGWQKIGDNWYYLENAVPRTGWLTDQGRKYYLNQDGVMVTGWKQIDGDYYYFHLDGGMNLGELILGETVYHFDEEGRLETVNRVPETGGGAYLAGFLDSDSQELLDSMNEEKRDQYFDAYGDREEEYNNEGRGRRAFDRYASFQINMTLQKAAMERLLAARENGYAGEAVYGGGTINDYLKTISHYGSRTCKEVFLRNCKDPGEAWEKLTYKMEEKYNDRDDRKYRLEYYREVGFSRLEENGVSDYLIIFMR